MNDIASNLTPKKIGKKYGYVDSDGNIVISPSFDEANPFEGDVARVSIKYRWGLIDRNGDLLGEPVFTHIDEFSEGLARAGFDRYWGYIKPNAEWAVEPQFRNAFRFCDGITAVRKHQGLYGFIDYEGNYVIPPTFENIKTVDGWYPYKNKSIVLVRVEGKWGAINRNGDFVIEPTFDNVSGFQDGFAEACLGQERKWIDIYGNITIAKD